MQLWLFIAYILSCVVDSVDQRRARGMFGHVGAARHRHDDARTAGPQLSESAHCRRQFFVFDERQNNSNCLSQLLATESDEIQNNAKGLSQRPRPKPANPK
jgi:hypothetical protein